MCTNHHNLRSSILSCCLVNGHLEHSNLFLFDWKAHVQLMLTIASKVEFDSMNYNHLVFTDWSETDIGTVVKQYIITRL